MPVILTVTRYLFLLTSNYCMGVLCNQDRLRDRGQIWVGNDCQRVANDAALRVW
jgi:hypothetical protein